MPTVSPVTMAVPPPSLIRAAAAVPVPEATPDFRIPKNLYIPPPLSLNDGFAKVIAHNVAAMPVVPTSNVAADALPSTALITFDILLDFNVAA